jgi:hypothetical protein
MNVRRSIAGALGTAIFIYMAGAAEATTILSEDFDDISALPGGWAMVNISAPAGSTGWFQGNPGIFTAQQGADDAYIGANFLNADFGGNVSNWLLTPVVNVRNGDTLSFYTRTEIGAPFPDRLEVRLSANGASGDVGGTDTSVGDFTTLLLSINPGLAFGGYPEDWTAYSVVVSGLGGATDARLAFRYSVEDTNVNGNYIGIDTVRLEQRVAEPSSILLFLLGAAGLSRKRRAVKRA